MEEFYQYIGRASSSANSAPLAREKLFLYTSPRENALNRCGDVPVGAYFACASLSVLDDQVWMQIRRGMFSNAALNGYVRVEFDFSSDHDSASELPAYMQTQSRVTRPTAFKYLRRLPTFPTFLCTRERLLVTRTPVFATLQQQQQHAVSSRDQRFVPAVSVVHATDSQFSPDFAHLAVKVTTTFGLTGWITASFSEHLVVVDDPRVLVMSDSAPVLVQNVAARTSKWHGALPVRAVPSLQAPRTGSLAPFQIVEAVERKLVKDQVWIRIRSEASDPATANDRPNEAETDATRPSLPAQPTAAATAWVIERNVNTCERVVVPWSADSYASAVSASDGTDTPTRFYRNVYARRALPLRAAPDLSADIVGHVAPGAVVASSKRVRSSSGAMWLELALERSPLTNTLDDAPSPPLVGFAIQSNAKTNRCMLYEIAPPDCKFAPPALVAIHATASNGLDNAAAGSYIMARTAPRATANALFGVRSGAVVTAVGAQFVAAEQRVWLQVLASDVDAAMRVALPNVVVTPDEQQQRVVYVAVADESDGTIVVAQRVQVRQLVKVPTPHVASSPSSDARKSRVVFSGRASKLFGSQLMQPSTLDLPLGKAKTMSVGAMRPAAAAAGELQSDVDAAHALKAEIAQWQLQETRVNAVAAFARECVSQLRACVVRPIRACFATTIALRKYEQLYTSDNGDEDYDNAANGDDDDDGAVVGSRLRAHERVAEVQV